MSTRQPESSGGAHGDRRGQLWVIAAPSGAGKTSLVRALLERDPGLKFSISYTTRPPRSAEVHGRDYFFVAEAQFLEMVGRNEFLEHARVFDHWYGTGRAHVEGLLADGFSVLLEIDWQGARQVREQAPGSSSVFILPPSIAELERRLRGRKTDAEAVIRRRLQDAMGDMSHWPEFDHVVINADFTAALERLTAVIAGREHRCRTALPETRAAAAAILAGHD
jgi:guanylate kinase